MRRLLSALCAVGLLAGCATEPLPDYRYYRPLPPQAVQALASPKLVGGLVVDAFRARGVLSERPILYANAEQPQRLLQYHYQLWIDPPGAILQRRFVDLLSNYRVAEYVSDRASPRAEPAMLTGEIERFERVKHAAGWRIIVGLRIRIEAPRSAAPILDKYYEESREVAADNLSESVDGFGAAIDAIAARLVVDLPSASK